jgi:cleavage and polyadenylation specificity factor subunit 1
MSKPVFVAEGLCFLPPFLTTEYYPKRNTSKAAITEIIAADIGDATSRSPHLIVRRLRLLYLSYADQQIRTSTDDLVIYKAFHYPARAASDPWTKNLRWIKLSQQHVPRYTDELDGADGDAGLRSTLVPLDDVCGYSTVFRKGTSPAFILKESSSAPRVIGLHGKAVKGFTRFNTSECQKGFAYLDADVSNLIYCVNAH